MNPMIGNNVMMFVIPILISVAINIKIKVNPRLTVVPAIMVNPNFLEIDELVFSVLKFPIIPKYASNNANPQGLKTAIIPAEIVKVNGPI